VPFCERRYTISIRGEADGEIIYVGVEGHGVSSVWASVRWQEEREPRERRQTVPVFLSPMNLRWNETFRRFEAEFSTDFNEDLAAVKTAGFKTDGAPGWVWYSYKAAPLQNLRENRPASGLTITPEAREQFAPLAQMEANNAKLKADLAAHNKTLKKKLKIEEQEGKATPIPAKGYIDASDLPPLTAACVKYTPPPPPTALCIICKTPVYFYEKQDPPTCLWCELTVLDNATEVC